MRETSELSEEQESEEFDVRRYVNLVRRRHMLFLMSLLIGWALVWGSAWVLPARYKSTTLIQVEEPTMPKNYVAPNISEDLQDRLQSITQQILSRTRLLSIINQLHLYEGGHGQATPDEQVDQMRKDIDVKLVQGKNNEEIIGFTISYSAHDPRIAQQVTGQLTNLFINDNLMVQQQESENTTKFMQDQLENAKNALAAQETRVRQFETQHEGEMPSQEAANLQILGGLQAQLQSEEDNLNSAQQHGIYLQSLIGQYKTLGSITSTANGSPSDLSAIDKELEELRSRLVELSAQYTDSYPDIRALKTQIAKTEKLRDNLIVNFKKKDAHAAPSAGSAATGETGIAWQDALAQLQSQLQENRAEVADRSHAVADLKARVNEYQARLNAEPASEQQLAALTLGYDQSKTTYDDLLKKENESEMATSMELMQQGERFTMLDPPSLPLKPYFPNRLKLCEIGLGVGLVLGIVVVGSFELLDDRLHSEMGIRALLPVSVISEIPVIVIPSDARRNEIRTALGWAMAAFVIVTIAAGAAFSYFHS